MSSDDDDRTMRSRRRNGSRGRKRPANDSPVEGNSTNEKEALKRKKRIVDDDDNDSDEGEMELVDSSVAEKNADSSDSLEKKTSKTKIKPIARKKDDGGNEDVTSSSSSPSRLISDILNRVSPTRSSPSDVRSSRPTQDTTKDKASKVPKKTKVTEAPKSLLANMSMHPPPAKEETARQKPATKPVSRPPSSRSETNPSNSSRTSRPSQGRGKVNPPGQQPTQQQATNTVTQPVKAPVRSRAYKLVETAVVKNLQELCHTTKLTLPLNTTRQRIDLSGSFLPQEEAQDFFDRNEAGDVVLEPRKPIFPEDFSSGMKDHALSWWGIVDPKNERPRTGRRS